MPNPVETVLRLVTSSVQILHASEQAALPNPKIQAQALQWMRNRPVISTPDIRPNFNPFKSPETARGSIDVIVSNPEIAFPKDGNQSYLQLHHLPGGSTLATFMGQHPDKYEDVYIFDVNLAVLDPNGAWEITDQLWQEDFRNGDYRNPNIDVYGDLAAMVVYGPNGPELWPINLSNKIAEFQRDKVFPIPAVNADQESLVQGSGNIAIGKLHINYGALVATQEMYLVFDKGDSKLVMQTVAQMLATDGDGNYEPFAASIQLPATEIALKDNNPSVLAKILDGSITPNIKYLTDPNNPSKEGFYFVLDGIPPIFIAYGQHPEAIYNPVSNKFFAAAATSYGIILVEANSNAEPVVVSDYKDPLPFGCAVGRNGQMIFVSQTQRRNQPGRIEAQIISSQGEKEGNNFVIEEAHIGNILGTPAVTAIEGGWVIAYTEGPDAQHPMLQLIYVSEDGKQIKKLWLKDSSGHKITIQEQYPAMIDDLQETVKSVSQQQPNIINPFVSLFSQPHITEKVNQPSYLTRTIGRPNNPVLDIPTITNQ